MYSGYQKVKSAEEVRDKLANGFKTDFSVGRWYLCWKDQRWYVSAEIRKQFPGVFVDQKTEEPEEVIATPEQPIPNQKPELMVISEIPAIPLPPEEYVLNDMLADILEMIASIEGLHQIDNEEKHELPFAQTKGENKFSPKSSGEVMLSLHDIVIYFLLDIYKEYHSIDDKLALLRLERTAVEMQSKQIEEANNAFCQYILEHSLSQPPEIVMEQIDTRMPMMVEA